MPILNFKNKEHLSSMIIGSGHTIMAGFIPKVVKPEVFSEKYYEWTKPTPETISKFGLFGSDIDYNTYYPNVDPGEFQPKEEEFIEPIFRLLSATIVSKNWNPTDFSQPGVLRNSMSMLLGQTVNCDHETNIGNAIGAVSKVMWQDAYKDGSFMIPAGINGVLRIDGKANPRIARGILMEPPSIHSNSVTVQFKWDKSHPEMGDNEFFEKLGTYDSKGNMVRRMVTEVVRYLETSLVSHGADSFAQKVGSDGKIINPSFAKRTWNSYSEYEEVTDKQYYFNDFKSIKEDIVENNDTQEPLNNNPGNNINQIKMNEELQLFIASLFGEGLLNLAEGQEQNAENALAALKAIIGDKASLADQVTNLEAEKTSLTEKVTNLETQVANLQEMATVGKSHIASLRESAITNYKKLKGDSVDETIITMLNSETTGLATLISLNKEYTDQLNEKFPMTCSKCGSHDISRASSIGNPEGSVVTEKNTEASTLDVLKDLYNKKMK